MKNINIFKIFLIFVQNTENDKLIKECCCVLESCKQIYNYQCFKSDIQTQIEDYLIKRMKDKTHHVDIKFKNAEIEQTIHNKADKMKRLTLKKELQKDFNDDIMKVTIQDQQKNQLVKNLEIWLQSTVKDKLIITKSEFIQSFLKEDENLEIYFQFFMDPYMYIASHEFHKYVEFLDKNTEVPDILKNQPPFRQKKDFIPNSFSLYVYRASKVMLSFIQPDNFQRLLKINPNIIQFYFKTLYSTLQDLEHKNYNPYINHIVKTLIHLFQNYDKSSVNPIIEFGKNNFLFKFLEYLDYPLMNIFLLDILGVSNNSILSTFQQKFWKYLQTAKFFIELSRIMVYHDFSQSITKFDNNYLMSEIKIEIRQQQLDENQEKNFQLQKSVLNNSRLKNTNLKYLIYEDFNIHSKDIDKMKKICVKKILNQFNIKDCLHIQHNYKNQAQKQPRSKQSQKFQKVQMPQMTISAVQKIRSKFLNVNQNLVQKLLQFSKNVKEKLKNNKNFKDRFQSLHNDPVEVVFNKVRKQQSIIQIAFYQKQENFIEIKQLKKQEIYPSSMFEIQFCEMEEKKKKNFSDIDFLLSIEDYSQKCAIIFENCINSALIQKFDFIYSKIVDQTLLLQAILKPDKFQVFRDILENYLFKYEINLHLEEQNSSLICGRIVNQILRNYSKIEMPEISIISNQYFMMINRLIIKSMNMFTENKDIYIQDIIIEGGLRVCRIQLVETFYYIILNSENPKEILNQVLIPTWDCLILLFFNYKINSTYLQLFQKIMEIVAQEGDQPLFFNIFIKLNLFSKHFKVFLLITFY